MFRQPSKRTLRRRVARDVEDICREVTEEVNRFISKRKRVNADDEGASASSSNRTWMEVPVDVHEASLWSSAVEHTDDSDGYSDSSSEEEDGRIRIVYVELKDITDYFDYPINSSEMHVYKATLGTDVLYTDLPTSIHFTMSNQRQAKRPRRIKEQDSVYLWDTTPPLSPEADPNAADESSNDTLPTGRCSERPGSSQSLAQTDSLLALHMKMNILAKRQLWIMSMLRRLISRQRTQELVAGGSSAAPIEQGCNMPANPVTQPIASRVGFQQLNTRLQEPPFRKEMESYLLCLGGKNSDDFVKRIYYSIFDDTIALELNFQGRKGKDSLCGSKFYELVTEIYVK